MLCALDLARQIETGKIKPADVIRQCAETIAAAEAKIGAFTALDVDAAHRRATEASTALASLPLRGLPVGVKDIFDTADLPTEYGSPIYKGYRPKADSSAVAMIRRAGGIILGKTVTTEFAYRTPGKTRNPWNIEHTPGGSSSGSAAGIAAGMFPIATGTQTAGSVIRPASFCGIAGFKPSYKLLPTIGVKCFAWNLDTVGLFAARVADVAYAAAAMSGRDLRVDRKAPAAPRIAVVRTHLWDEASEAMQSALAKAARAAEAAGARIKDVTLPKIFEEASEAQNLIQCYEAYFSLAYEYDHHRDQLSPALRDTLDEMAKLKPEAYDAARRTTKQARQAFNDLMIDVDAILTPSAPGAAPKGLSFTGATTFNRLWTLIGSPCVSVPGLTDESGLPLGVQIVGRFGRDLAALEAALFVERAIG